MCSVVGCVLVGVVLDVRDFVKEVQRLLCWCVYVCLYGAGVVPGREPWVYGLMVAF